MEKRLGQTKKLHWNDLFEVKAMIGILASGALGATISRAIKMRDIEKISELKTIWSMFLAQVLIGTALDALSRW